MILCSGEALIDMLPFRAEEGTAGMVPHAGGAVFNTAIALGRLGVPVGMYTGLSDDMFGRQLDETLSASHVDTALAERSSRPTTLAFVELTHGQAKYMFYDENTAARMLSPDRLPELGQEVEALFCGGISLMAEPGGAAHEALALREASRRVVMIDPNIRPGFIQDEPAYRARIERMIKAAHIVKLSDEDLVWLEGDGDLEALARGIVARGPKLVCITEGAKGAFGVTDHLCIRVPAQKVTVADTVGAGDTFNAGLLAGLHQSGALRGGTLATLETAVLEDALALGVEAAAITVSRPGANPPWRDEL